MNADPRRQSLERFANVCKKKKMDASKTVLHRSATNLAEEPGIRDYKSFTGLSRGQLLSTTAAYRRGLSAEGLPSRRKLSTRSFSWRARRITGAYDAVSAGISRSKWFLQRVRFRNDIQFVRLLILSVLGRSP
jgi:hypothetical protein